MAGSFLPSFIFGGDTGNTPESLKLQRQMALQAMLAGDSPKNVGEGFNSIGRSIAAALMDRQAAEQEKVGQAGALEAMRGSETLGPLLGGGAPTGLSSMPAPTGDAGTPAQPSGGGKLPIMGYAVGNAPAVSTDETGAKLNEYFEGNARSLGMTNPVFEQRTLAFLNDNPYGVGIRSLDRSIAQQAQLYARYKQQGGAPVAPPGRSNHNHGLAADLSYEDPRATAWAHANAARYGLAFPVKSEDWHVEPMENRGMRFAGAQTGQGQASPIQVADASGQVPLPPVRPPELGGAVPLPPARPANMAAEKLPIPPGQYLAQRQSAMDQAAREDASAPKAPPPVLGANGLPSPFVKPQQVAQAAPPQTGGTLSPGDRAALANPFVPQAMKEIILKKATRDPAEVEMKQLELQKARRDVNGPGYQLDIQGKQLANRKAEKDLAGMGYQSLITPEERARYGVPNDYKGAVQVDRDGQLHFPGKAGTEVTLKNEGTIPPGYKATRDANGNVISLEAIPGGEAATKQAEAKKKETERARQSSMKGNVVLNALDDVERVMSSSTLPTTGMLGSRLSSVPGTAAHDVATSLGTIGANISFENLNQMRQASPTGGALGAVSDRENEMLKSAWGALQQSQSPEQFKRNLGRVRTIFNEIVHGKEAAAKMESDRMSGVREIRSKEDYDALPSGTKFLAPDGSTRVKP